MDPEHYQELLQGPIFLQDKNPTERSSAARKQEIKMAKVYTTDHLSSIIRTHGWCTASNSAPYLLQHLKPSMRILDVGWGPGTISTGLTKYVQDGQAVGVK